MFSLIIYDFINRSLYQFLFIVINGNSFRNMNELESLHFNNYYGNLEIFILPSVLPKKLLGKTVKKSPDQNQELFLLLQLTIVVPTHKYKYKLSVKYTNVIEFMYYLLEFPDCIPSKIKRHSIKVNGITFFLKFIINTCTSKCNILLNISTDSTDIEVL